MKAETLNYYLDKLRNQSSVEKEQILTEIEAVVKAETPEERNEGIESIRQAVENIAQMLEPKLALQS